MLASDRRLAIVDRSPKFAVFSLASAIIINSTGVTNTPVSALAHDFEWVFNSIQAAFANSAHVYIYVPAGWVGHSDYPARNTGRIHLA
jgi:hypothetical protein